jgi:hypothetical protein
MAIRLLSFDIKGGGRLNKREVKGDRPELVPAAKRV